MALQWNCIISFCGWSSYVISVRLRQYLGIAPYIIERVPRYLGWRGNTFFSQTCFFFVMRRFLYEFVHRRQIRFGSFCCVLALYVLSLVAVTCDNWPLRVISNFHFGKQKIHSVWHFVFSDHCLTLYFLSRSHNSPFHPIHLKHFGNHQFPLLGTIIFR